MPCSMNRILRRAALIPLLWLAALSAPAAAAELSADDVYVKKASWPETLLATREALARAGSADPALALRVWMMMEKDFPIPCDWMQQDVGALCGRWLVEPDAPRTLRRMAQRALEGAGAKAPALRARLGELNGAAEPRALLALYLEACEARRAERLRPLLEKAPRLVFTRHCNMGGSHYAYTESQSDAQRERHFAPGAALCTLTMDGIYGKAETLLEDPHGIIRDPDVSFDGRRVLFSWKKSDLLDDYHLYELDLATRRVRQLTHGRAVADIEGIYLPGGDILFNSTRCVQMVAAYPAEVSNFYTCDADGRFVRRLAFDQAHDNSPTLAEDGRILYTRWEFNDRGQTFPQKLFQMNPDGTGQTEFYGNNSFFPTTILHARAIPGSQQALAIATGHRNWQAGKLIVIDPAKGRQEAEGVRLVAPPRLTEPVQQVGYGQEGELFQYPYPLGGDACLVAYHPTGWIPPDVIVSPSPNRVLKSVYPRFGIYFMTLDGRRELLAADPDLPCNQPIPLRPRLKPRPRPSMVDYTKADGTFYVQDVYAGPGLAGVKRGEVKRLRVVALQYRPAALGFNFSDESSVYTPVAIGNGAWDVKTILGDAEVREDGSVFFRAPARTPVYFQLLDARGRLVQTMRSWSTLQPGENAQCMGCHEHKNSAPQERTRLTRALMAGPQALRPFYGPPRGFSFVKEIQPILDRHCISCHDGSKHELSLKGEQFPDLEQAERMWSDAYWSLTGARIIEKRFGAKMMSTASDPLVNWISAQSSPPLIRPRSAGSGCSGLMAMLEKGHQKVKLRAEELDKLAAWIDLAVPYCGDYAEAAAWSAEEEALHRVMLQKRRRLEAEERKAIEALVKMKGLRKGGADPAKEAADSASSEAGSEYRNLAWGGQWAKVGGAWRLDFARAAQIDRLSVAPQAAGAKRGQELKVVVETSDGTRDEFTLPGSAAPHSLPLRPRAVRWIQVRGLPAASGVVQVWGRDAAPLEVIAGDRIRYTKNDPAASAAARY